MDRIFITMPNTPVFSYVFKKRERVVCFLFFFLIFNIVCASNENITTKTLDEMRSEFQENPDRKDILNKVSVYISNLGKWIDEDSIYSKKKLNLIDSLEKQLLKTNDTREQYDYCYHLFLEYGDLSFDKMCAYALECNDLAEELGDKHLITSSKLSEAQTYIIKRHDSRSFSTAR